MAKESRLLTIPKKLADEYNAQQRKIPLKDWIKLAIWQAWEKEQTTKTMGLKEEIRKDNQDHNTLFP